jgi:hypothetical protein
MGIFLILERANNCRGISQVNNSIFLCHCDFILKRPNFIADFKEVLHITAHLGIASFKASTG